MNRFLEKEHKPGDTPQMLLNPPPQAVPELGTPGPQGKHKVDLTYIVNYGIYVLNFGLFALIILLSEEEKRFL